MSSASQSAKLQTAWLWFAFAALGIPAAGFAAILFDIQVARLIYGQASPLGLGIEIASLSALVASIVLLRWRLAQAPSPTGIVRHVLDFLALAHWHPAVRFAFAGLLALPPVWFSITNRWFFITLHDLGRRALAMTDVQNSIDALGVAYQVVLMGGLPLLFVQHLLCRWKPSSRILPWLILPVLFVGTIIAAIILVTLAHFSQS